MREKMTMRPDYQQPHSIRDYNPERNVALREHLIMKEHHRQKYEGRRHNGRRNRLLRYGVL